MILGMQISRFGSREQAMPLLNQGIADYEAMVKSTREPGVTRELATSISLRADAELRFGDLSAANADFHRAFDLLVRPAKLDPENQMLQSDLWVGEFEIARALAVSGKYREALPQLIRAFDGYMSLHLEDDVGPGPGEMKAWIGDAQAGTHHFAEALKSYQEAAVILAKDESSFDDARCDLAMVETKIANMLLLMGKLKEANLQYAQALDKAKLAPALAHMDIPALYAAAEAYTGMGNAAAEEARSVKEAALRSGLCEQARTSYRKSLDIWKHIPNPARYGPNGYLVRPPAEVAKLLAQGESTQQLDVSAP